MMQQSPKRVAGVVMVDPIVFLLHFHSIAYNFVHRAPKRLMEVCINTTMGYYFANVHLSHICLLCVLFPSMLFITLPLVSSIYPTISRGTFNGFRPRTLFNQRQAPGHPARPPGAMPKQLAQPCPSSSLRMTTLLIALECINTF
jgi:hypothetical protein